ncbi:hypothetical protein Dxin01_01223 [Deinococcus xinjiangensis]|uniref:Uncharacterized protein n=1 Tax=Deinococcus xinjiangensis TaxID=457454 RepID=A0ABP9V9W4_9DEIO
MKTGPVPTPPPKNEGEYARKLALAILSTLEQKGILSRFDVDTILQAAHRAAQTASPQGSIPAPSPQVQITLSPAPPAPLGTRWVKPAGASAPKREPEKSDSEKSDSAKGNPPNQDPPNQAKSSQEKSNQAKSEAQPVTRPPEAEAGVLPPEERGQGAAEAEVRSANKKNTTPAENQPPVIDFTLD